MSSVSLDGPVSDADRQRLAALLRLVRDVLDSTQLTADDDLAGHGGTSLSMVRIVAMASRTLSLDIDPRRLPAVVTVRDLARVAQPPDRA